MAATVTMRALSWSWPSSVEPPQLYTHSTFAAVTPPLNDTWNNTDVVTQPASNTQDNQDNYWALLALGLVFATAAGNILVCLAITWERRLQNVTNYFLMSLAITDLMVAILVMPFGILTLFKGKSFLLLP